MSEKIRGLGTMNVGGKPRPFHVNSLRQSNAFCEVMNLPSPDDYWSEMAKLAKGGALSSANITIAFIYSALYAGAVRQRITVDFTYQDVLDWFEDADASEADEFAKPMNLLLEMLPKPTDEEVSGKE